MSIRQIPVFAFPSTLKFFLNSKSSHTQILTLYSPFDFAVKFKVSCHSSAWEKYTVTDAEGSIPPQSSVDLVVSHKMPIPANCNVTDKFKVVILDHTTDQVIGRKYIESVLLPGEKDHRHHDDDFEFSKSPLSDQGSVRSFGQRKTPERMDRASVSNSNTLIYAVIVGCCTVALFLPTRPEPVTESSLPMYLHVSHNIQVMAALFLGIFLCLMIRT